MIFVVVFLALIGLAIRRFLRSTFDRSLRLRLLLVRLIAACATFGAIALWQGWEKYAQGGRSLDLLITGLILFGGYGLGEWCARRRLAKAGIVPQEGLRGPLY